MKILIDDEKNTLPDGSVPDLIARNFAAAISLIEWLNHMCDWQFEAPMQTENVEIYLDHDLGGERSGYDIISWLEEKKRVDYVELPLKIVCVSNNGAGRQRIEQVVEKLYGRIFH